MKKIISIIFIILVFFILYFLQANFFTWFNISGIMPNLFVIFCLFLGLFPKKKMGIIFGVLFGIYIDLVIGKTIGITGILLGLIGFIGELLSKNFSKDSRFTIMLMVMFATAVFEVLLYVYNIIKYGLIIEPISFIKILIIEVLFNAILTIIFYPIIKKLGYKLENIYEEKVMITRFF